MPDIIKVYTPGAQGAQGLQGLQGAAGTGLTGLSSLTIAGNYTPSVAEYANVVMSFAGTLSAEAIITLPAIVGFVREIRNVTAGGHALLVSGGSGDRAEINNGESCMVVWNGTSYIRLDPYTRTFNVRDFGAKGDGVANDTAAIQAAIQAAGKESVLPSGVGGTVYLPRGRYLCDQLKAIDDTANGNVRGIKFIGDFAGADGNPLGSFISARTGGYRTTISVTSGLGVVTFSVVATTGFTNGDIVTFIRYDGTILCSRTLVSKTATTITVSSALTEAVIGVQERAFKGCDVTNAKPMFLAYGRGFIFEGIGFFSNNLVVLAGIAATRSSGAGSGLCTNLQMRNCRMGTEGGGGKMYYGLLHGDNPDLPGTPQLAFPGFPEQCEVFELYRTYMQSVDIGWYTPNTGGQTKQATFDSGAVIACKYGIYFASGSFILDRANFGSATVANAFMSGNTDGCILRDTLSEFSRCFFISSAASVSGNPHVMTGGRHDCTFVTDRKTTINAAHAAGVTTLTVASTTGFEPGQRVSIYRAASVGLSTVAYITDIVSSTTLTIDIVTAYSYGTGDILRDVFDNAAMVLNSPAGHIIDGTSFDAVYHPRVKFLAFSNLDGTASFGTDVMWKNVCFPNDTPFYDERWYGTFYGYVGGSYVWTIGCRGCSATNSNNQISLPDLYGKPMGGGAETVTKAGVLHSVNAIEMMRTTATTIKKADQLHNQPTTNLIIAGQKPWSNSGGAASGVNRNSGNVELSIPAPVAGGVAGTILATSEGNTTMQVDGDITDGQTAILLRRNVAGVFTLQRVTMGAADSGGTGFKLLRVVN